MKPYKIIATPDVELGCFDEADLVGLRVRGESSWLLFSRKNWQQLVTAWTEYEKVSTREADPRVYKTRPDSW